MKANILALTVLVLPAVSSGLEWTVDHTWESWEDGASIAWRADQPGTLSHTYGDGGLRCVFTRSSGVHVHVNVDVALAWVKDLLEGDTVAATLDMGASFWPASGDYWCPRFSGYWNEDDSSVYGSVWLAAEDLVDSGCGVYFQQYELNLIVPEGVQGLVLGGSLPVSSTPHGVVVRRIEITLPDHASVELPLGEAVPAQGGAFSWVKALY